MLDSLKNCQPQAYAAMRAVAGFMFLWHGAQKLLDFPAAPPPDAPLFILYTAGPIELIGGGLILVGLYARYAAILSSATMLVAYFIGHLFRPGLEDIGPLHYIFPLINGGELAALYCFVFLFIVTKGNGAYSLGGDEG